MCLNFMHRSMKEYSMGNFHAVSRENSPLGFFIQIFLRIQEEKSPGTPRWKLSHMCTQKLGGKEDTMSGRKNDPIWIHFQKLQSTANTECRAKCKNVAMRCKGLWCRKGTQLIWSGSVQAEKPSGNS